MDLNKNTKTILVTGAAGFIGAALVKALLALDFKVVGIDNLNDVNITYQIKQSKSHCYYTAHVRLHFIGIL